MNGYPPRQDATVSQFLPQISAPQGFPTRTVMGEVGPVGYPDPLRTTPAVKLLREAVFYIDANNSQSGERYAKNQGTGGSALDALYGNSLVASANDPLWLPRPVDGQNYVYLPGIAGNTIGCTAPASAVSYAAYPVDGSAATTGAATGGAAFTLQTAGSWQQVDLLDVGAGVVASFIAANSAGTGYTDAYSVVWTLARAANGRKTVLVNAGPCWLFGTNNYMRLRGLTPAIEFGSGQAFTALVIIRQWPTPITNGRFFSNYGAPRGWIFCNAASPVTNFVMAPATGALSQTTGTGALGALKLYAGGRSTAMTGFNYVSNTRTTQASIIASSLASGLPLMIGADPALANANLNGELLAAAIFRRALTPTEIRTICTHFGTV